MERLVSRIKELQVAGIPVGNAILLLAGLGTSDVLVPILNRFINIPAVSGAAISAIVQLPMIRRLIGDSAAAVLSATSMAVGLEQQLQVRARAQQLASRILGTVGLAGSPRISLSGSQETSSPSRSIPSVRLGQQVQPMSEAERRALATMAVPS